MNHIFNEDEQFAKYNSDASIDDIPLANEQ